MRANTDKQNAMSGGKKGNVASETFDGVVVRSTAKALLIDINGREVWIPFSQILTEEKQIDGTVKIRIPQWLAKAKLLI